MRIRRSLLCSCVLLLSQAGFSEVRLPLLVSDGMVLQRDTPVTVWGWAGEDETVTINFAGKTCRTTAGADGKWTVTLPGRAAGGPYNMEIIADNHIDLRDILIGDVWFISGQSNIYVSFRAFINQPVNRAQDILLQSNINGIRLFKVKDGSSAVECDRIEGVWQ